MEDPKPLRNPEIKYTKLFINNEWVDSNSGKTICTINPATEQKIAEVQEGDEADIDRAVAAARKAFEIGSTWRTMDASARGRLLMKLADLIDRDRLYLASLETLNIGETFSRLKGTIAGSTKLLRYAAGWADKNVGQTIPVDGSYLCYTRHEPVGVCGLITPSNNPAFLLLWELGPALACGCTVVLKPAEQTPLTTLYLASLFMEAGFPPGVVNVVPGYGPIAGDALVRHPGVDRVAFIGSNQVGPLIHAAGGSNLKKVTSAMRGNNANVVFADADLDLALNKVYIGAYGSNGQTCGASTRIFVQEEIYDEFINRSLEKAKARKIGDPFDPENEAGPLKDKGTLDRVIRLVNSAVEQGAKLHCGGKRIGEVGYFFETTLLSDITDEMTITQEEIFGPVMCILKFKSDEDIVKRVNASRYGLDAAVYTSDMDRAMTMVQSIQAGIVWINTNKSFSPNAPFNNFKQSGIGCRSGSYVMDTYTEVKTVMIRVPQKNS